MKWIEIPLNGQPLLTDFGGGFLQAGIEATQAWYQQVGFQPPWVGYIAVENESPRGLCAFKTAPNQGRVEIAYGTVPGCENQGVATAMARRLLEIAEETDPDIVVFAQTLPEENASTTILKKLGFVLSGPVEHPEDGTVWEWVHP
ncbi:MAG: GNAT family N-acetyltransferase [Planctomycetaceae bacterium]|nr:GNAT family N-acetyltransferase [Planctomycetaceae bacterium]